jgi:hypothetical protein
MRRVAMMSMGWHEVYSTTPARQPERSSRASAELPAPASEDEERKTASLALPDRKREEEEAAEAGVEEP